MPFKLAEVEVMSRADPVLAVRVAEVVTEELELEEELDDEPPEVVNDIKSPLTVIPVVELYA